MIRKIFLALLLTFTATAFADQLNSTGQAPSNVELRQQIAANMAKAAKEREESHQVNAKLLARTDAVITREEKILKRQEQDLARYEKILSTWEHQQAQYQKYLDSLGSK